MNPVLPAESRLQEACPASGWKARIAEQFGKPEGRLGRLVGVTLEFKNKARSQWVLELLQIEPVDRVLEIGFGSGRDLRRVHARASQGLTAGIDHSAEMVKMARAKSIGGITEGRVDIRLAPAERIPFPDDRFTKVYSINSVQFWPRRAAAFREIRRVLRPGGLVAIALEPRGDSTPELAQANGRTIADELETAGFNNVRLESSSFGRVPTVCAIGVKDATE